MPLAWKLPISWGWENGVIENVQTALLLLGMCVSLAAAYRSRPPMRAMWLVAACFWLVMSGRELAWGAAFLPPTGFDPVTGPLITSKILWYKPAVAWVVGALLLWVIYLTVRHRLVQRVVWPWFKNGAMPWPTLGIFVLAMVLAAHAEGNPLPGLPVPPKGSDMVMEEMAELWGYMALFWSQWLLMLRTPRH